MSACIGLRYEEGVSPYSIIFPYAMVIASAFRDSPAFQAAVNTSCGFSERRRSFSSSRSASCLMCSVFSSNYYM